MAEPIPVEALEVIKGSQLPEVTNPEDMTFLGYENTSVPQDTVRISFENMTPLFGVTQVKGQSVLLAPSQKLFTDELDSKIDGRVIYNISQSTGNYAYTDKTTARNSVPTNLRGLGQFVTYKLSTGWVNEQYVGTDISGWATDGNWKNDTVIVNPFMIQQLGLWKPHTVEEIYVDISKIIKSFIINITSNFRKNDGNIRRIKIRSEQYTPSTSTASIALDVESVDGIFVNAGIKNTTNGFVTFDLDFGSISIELNIDRMSVIVPNTPTTYQQGGISEKLIENAVINFESKRKRIYKNVNWVGMSIWWYDGEVLTGTSEIARGYQTLLKEQFWFKSDTGTNYCYSGNSLGGLSVGDTSSIMNHSSSWTGTLGDIWTLDSITNDFKRNIPIGTINDYNNATGITTFYGALRAYKNKVISLSGSTAIVICANSLRRNNSGYTSTSTNTVGATLVDYEKAMMTVASLNKWSFVDQFRMSGITDDSIFITTLDGLHLNNFGYTLAVLPWISIFDSLYNKSKIQ